MGGGAGGDTGRSEKRVWILESVPGTGSLQGVLPWPFLLPETWQRGAIQEKRMGQVPPTVSCWCPNKRYLPALAGG